MRNMKRLGLGFILLTATGAWAEGPAPCTDFTGHWEGVCRVSPGYLGGYFGAFGGDEIKSEVKITQSQCHYFRVNDDLIAAGGTLSKSLFIPVPDGPDYYVYASTYLNWTDGTRKDLGFYTKELIYRNGFGLVYNGDIYGKSTIEDGKLVSHSRGPGFQSDCIYNRVDE